MLVTHAGTHMHIQTRNMHVVAVSGLRLKACDIDGALFYLTTIAYLFDFDFDTDPPFGLLRISFALLRGIVQWCDGSFVSVSTDHLTKLQPWPLTAAYTASLTASSHQAQNRA